MTEKAIIENFLKAKKIAIFGHINPDADAFGSMFSIKELATNLGKEAEVFALERGKSFLDDIFPLTEIKQDFDAKRFDLVVCVDMHAMQRIDKIFVEQIKKSKKIVVIDHHEISGKEELICKNNFCQPDKAATCEIITDLLRKHDLKITNKMATYLWAGLIGDTDRFLHDNLTDNVLEVAKYLKKNGAEAQFVYDKMFRNITMKQLKLQKFFFNQMKFVDRCCFCVVTQKDLKKLKATKQDFEIFPNMMKNFEGVEVSFLATEIEKNHFRFNVRTNGKNSLLVSVPNGGGGHKQASGFNFNGTVRDVKRMIPVWAKEILSERS